MRIIWIILFTCIAINGCSTRLSSLSQEELADIVIGGKAKSDRLAAFKKLSDDNQLFKVVINAKNNFVYKAVSKITDPELIGRIVLESDQHQVVKQAIRRLDDQLLLEDIATTSPHFDFRREAVTKLTNQSVLEKVALSDESAYVTHTAIGKILSKSVLSKLLLKDERWTVQNSSFNRLKALGHVDEDIYQKMARTMYQREFKNLLVENNNPVLLRSLAGNYDSTTSDGREAASRIKLILQHPILASREDINSFKVRIRERSQRYIFGSASKYMEGEDVEFSIKVNINGENKTYKMSWGSDFPKYYSDKFIKAKVNTDIFLSSLFAALELKPDEWEDLAKIGIPEIKFGAPE